MTDKRTLKLVEKVLEKCKPIQNQICAYLREHDNKKTEAIVSYAINNQTTDVFIEDENDDNYDNLYIISLFCAFANIYKYPNYKDILTSVIRREDLNYISVTDEFEVMLNEYGFVEVKELKDIVTLIVSNIMIFKIKDTYFTRCYMN